MSTTTIPPAERDSKTQREALAECELKIARAKTNTVESIRIIGRELTKIENELLYSTTSASFKEYVEVRVELSYKLARAWMRASEALEILYRQKLQLPYSQSQVLELSKVKDPGAMVKLWQDIVNFCDREKTTADFTLVKKAVDALRTQTSELITRASRKKKKTAKPGIEIDLGSTPNGEVIRKSIWSEKGEMALNRIRRMCGDDIADAVNNGNPKITEHDLKAWAALEPDMIRTLSYYIVFKRWSLKKAIAYEESAFTLLTTVEQLGDLARSRGGKAIAQIEDIKILIEIAS